MKIEKFYLNVKKTPQCWLWTKGKDKDGYGRVRIGHDMHYAHRVSYACAKGPIPKGLQVLHKCDNPPCVRPSHLFLGTNMDNVDDKVAKGRQSCSKGNAKLTTKQVRAIKKMGRTKTQKELAKMFGVGQSTISRVLRQESWVGY